MRISRITFTIGIAAACLGLTALHAAAQAPAPAGNGNRTPPMTSEELAKQPQTPGDTGDQQRHYYFAEAQTESPYRIYVP